MYCEHCGNKNELDHKFCTTCGNKISTINADRNAEVINNKSKFYPYIRLIKIILMVLGVIFFIALLVTPVEEEPIIEPTPSEDTVPEQQKDEVKPDTTTSVTSEEITALKKEIESLKSKTSKQSQSQQQTNQNVSTLKEELKSDEVVKNQTYEAQASVVLDSIAKVVCSLDKNKMSSGSGTIWSKGNKYYLVTNRHVLEDADTDDESCGITIARNWNAVADDPSAAYQNDDLLIYQLNQGYTYWEAEGLDLAITEIYEYEQPLSYLEDIAMETNEAECNETVAPGSKIKIIGFPYTSSVSLPTITEGIISSFEKTGEMLYYITSAKIEHGNSGGIAVTDDYYCMVGIPSAVVVGETESYGRILVLTEDDLKSFLDAME
jgi:hypothetical protein